MHSQILWHCRTSITTRCYKRPIPCAQQQVSATHSASRNFAHTAVLTRVWWAVLAELWELLVCMEQLLHLLDIISKSSDHGDVLLGQLCSNGVTLQQTFKALKQLEGCCQCGAVIKCLRPKNHIVGQPWSWPETAALIMPASPEAAALIMPAPPVRPLGPC